MGARSNIVIQDGADRVYLYGHWMACASIRHAAEGLRSDRYDDAHYLARIVFESMISESPGSTTGYGISTRLLDNQFPILVIAPRYRDVSAAPGTDGRADVWFESRDGSHLSRTYSRQEFLEVESGIPPWREGLGEHDCGFSRFIPADERDQRVEGW